LQAGLKRTHDQHGFLCVEQSNFQVGSSRSKVRVIPTVWMNPLSHRSPVLPALHGASSLRIQGPAAMDRATAAQRHHVAAPDSHQPMETEMRKEQKFWGPGISAPIFVFL
jgi:hypothetical protein